MENPKWRKFELAVKKIQEQLAPNSEIIHDYRVIGRISGVERQVDIALMTKVGQFDIFIAIDCKDYNKPVDVKDVESFVTMVSDIKADKGVMISYLGFTEAAKKIAQFNRIDLLRYLDAESEEWPVKINLPTIIDDRIIKDYSIQISSNYAGPLRIPVVDVRNLVVFDKSKKCLGTITDIVKLRWNLNQIKDEPGLNDYIMLGVYIRDEKDFYICDIKVSYHVKQTLYMGEIGVSELQGFFKENSGEVITKQLVTQRFCFEDIEKNWKVINSLKEVKNPPTIIMVVRGGY